MYIVIFTTLIALLFTYLDGKGQMKHGLKWAFVLVTLLGCIHYDYGNDYMAYYSSFKEVARTEFDIHSILDGYFTNEPGWVILCYAFTHLGGFFMMVAVLNIVQNYFVYNFIKKEVAKEWYFLAVFTFLCSESLYLYEFSMMRQSFVIFVFLGMWPYIKERKWWIPLIVLSACSLVHTSAKILIPFAFWGFIPFKRTKLIAVIYAALLIVLWFSAEYINQVMMAFMNFEDVQKYMDTYEGDVKGDGSISIGFILSILPLIITIYALLKSKELTSRQIMLICLSAVSFIIIPFTSFAPLIGRVGIYFAVFSIGALPLIYKSIENLQMRKVLLFLYVLVTSYSYVMFFRSEVWIKSYSTFHTIFSQM